MRRRVREEAGWNVVELRTGHDPMVSEPEELTAILLAVEVCSETVGVLCQRATRGRGGSPATLQALRVRDCCRIAIPVQVEVRGSRRDDKRIAACVG